jgi:histone H3/H4
MSFYKIFKMQHGHSIVLNKTLNRFLPRELKICKGAQTILLETIESCLMQFLQIIKEVVPQQKKVRPDCIFTVSNLLCLEGDILERAVAKFKSNSKLELQRLRAIYLRSKQTLNKNQISQNSIRVLSYLMDELAITLVSTACRFTAKEKQSVISEKDMQRAIMKISSVYVLTKGRNVNKENFTF